MGATPVNPRVPHGQRRRPDTWAALSGARTLSALSTAELMQILGAELLSEARDRRAHTGRPLLDELADTVARARVQGASGEQLALATKLVMALAPSAAGSGGPP
ncbi:MAG TPA: hypothetical protein VER33_28430 [Polyangiaceae bacterium]|nr:hypothetical protein [Polyangiaceae bacterium]